MAKIKTADLIAPDFQLAECIRQLETINGNLFGLKLGVASLIEAVERGSIDDAKTTIKVFNIKTLLDNLTTKA